VDDGAGLSDGEVFNFIFHAGFSTAAKVTDVFGRGVGMDVVKKQIQKLRGRIDIESRPGKGTAFFLRLPSRWP
jgi:chemotaxis protein histidine kinase CheA